MVCLGLNGPPSMCGLGSNYWRKKNASRQLSFICIFCIQTSFSADFCAYIYLPIVISRETYRLAGRYQCTQIAHIFLQYFKHIWYKPLRLYLALYVCRNEIICSGHKHLPHHRIRRFPNNSSKVQQFYTVNNWFHRCSTYQASRSYHEFWLAEIV